MSDFPLFQGSLVVERDAFSGIGCGYEYGVDSYIPVYVQAGKRLFVDSRVRHRLPDSFKSAHDIIYLSCFDGVFSEQELVKYSALAVAAVDTLSLEGEIFFDAGSADGILSIIALKKNALHAYAVDLDNYNGDVLSRHLNENGLRQSAVSFHALDLNDRNAMLSAIPLEEITVMAANLGPHYDGSHLAAIELLQRMPRVHTFVGGGYTLAGRYSPEDALNALSRYGFTEEFSPIVAQKESLESAPRMAFTIKRKM